jgi:hypothetical protein
VQRGILERRVASGSVEVLLVALACIFTWNICSDPLALRVARLDNLDRQQWSQGRLFRYAEQVHYPLSTFDDVWQGTVDIPQFIIETPPRSGSLRLLSGPDFSVIDREKLVKEFRTDGKDLCSICPRIDEPKAFMNVMLRGVPHASPSYIELEGFRRVSMPIWRWLLALTLSAYLGTLFIGLAGLAWRTCLCRLAWSFAGIEPGLDVSFFLSRCDLAG